MQSAPTTGVLAHLGEVPDAGAGADGGARVDVGGGGDDRAGVGHGRSWCRRRACRPILAQPRRPPLASSGRLSVSRRVISGPNRASTPEMSFIVRYQSPFGPLDDERMPGSAPDLSSSRHSEYPMSPRPAPSAALVGFVAALVVGGSLVVDGARRRRPSAADPCAAGGNPIVCENSKPGTDPSVWDIDWRRRRRASRASRPTSRVNVGCDDRLQDQDRRARRTRSTSTAPATTAASAPARSPR